MFMWSLKMDKASKLTEWIVIAVLKDGRGLEKGIKETHWKSVAILHINYTSKNVQLKNLWLCTKSMEIWRFDKMTNTESMSTIKITSIFFMSQLYTGSAKKFMWVFFFLWYHTEKHEWTFWPTQYLHFKYLTREI